MNSVEKGTCSELVVAIDLFKRGFAVFRALSAACPCDLIAMKDGKCYRIEVKSSVFGLMKAKEEKYDILAILGQDIIYYEGPRAKEAGIEMEIRL